MNIVLDEDGYPFVRGVYAHITDPTSPVWHFHLLRQLHERLANSSAEIDWVALARDAQANGFSEEGVVELLAFVIPFSAANRVYKIAADPRNPEGTFAFVTPRSEHPAKLDFSRASEQIIL